MVGTPGEYLELLVDAGCQASVWETTYQQVLAGEDPVLNWVRGTTLLPVRAALTEGQYAEFEQEYRQLLAEQYPSFVAPDGSELVNFPFRRIFMVAAKPS